MKFEVTLTLVVKARSAAAATDLGIAAAEHLVDTFNDDGSLNPLARVEVRPLGIGPAVGDRAPCKGCGVWLGYRGPIFGWRDAGSGRHYPNGSKHATKVAP